MAVDQNDQSVEVSGDGFLVVSVVLTGKPYDPYLPKKISSNKYMDSFESRGPLNPLLDPPFPHFNCWGFTLCFPHVQTPKSRITKIGFQ